MFLQYKLMYCTVQENFPSTNTQYIFGAVIQSLDCDVFFLINHLSIYLHLDLRKAVQHVTQSFCVTLRLYSTKQLVSSHHKKITRTVVQKMAWKFFSLILLWTCPQPLFSISIFSILFFSINHTKDETEKKKKK